MLVIKGNYRLSIDVVCYFLLEAIAICLEAIVIGFLNVFFMRIYIYIYMWFSFRLEAITFSLPKVPSWYQSQGRARCRTCRQVRSAVGVPVQAGVINPCVPTNIASEMAQGPLFSKGF